MEDAKIKKKRESIAETKKWLQFRDKWIEKQPTPLACAYCSRNDLVTDAPKNPKGRASHLFNRVKGLDQELIATVDHIHPQGKGGEKYDEDNFAVCCNQCNQLKRDLHLSEWIRQMQTIIDHVSKSKKKGVWHKLKTFM